MISFNANKIIDPSVVNPLVELEATSTDFVTENFFGNTDRRFNFYFLIQKLFDKYTLTVMTNELATFKSDIYLVFKGGNIIKAVIDKAENNVKDAVITVDDFKNTNELKMQYSLNDFNPTKRSDSDFSIYIDFPRIASMIRNDNERNLLFLKIIIACEKIAYNILDEIRTNYDPENGTVKITHYNSKSEMPITNLSDNLKNLGKLKDNYNQKFKDLIKKNIEYYEQFKSGKYDSSVSDFITHQKNVVVELLKILTSANIKLHNEQNFESDTLLNNVPMPRVAGFIINDKVNYDITGITNENSISLNKLTSFVGGKKYVSSNNNLTAKKKDLEMFFANEKGIPLIADDNSLFRIKKRNNNNVYSGFSIGNRDFDNDFLFKNFQYINNNNLVEYGISNVITKQSRNENLLYISSNRTLRFTKNDTDKTAFNLIRTKHNFRVFFELPYSIKMINGQNVDIKYFYLNIPGEFIDITVPTFADDALITYMKDFNKYITKRQMTLKQPNGQLFSQHIYTYSNYGLIHDIENIIFISTNNKPWTDNKYGKRLERFFRLYYAEIKGKIYIDDKIKEQLKSIMDALVFIKGKYENYKETKDKNYLGIIQQNLNVIYSEIKLIGEYIKKTTNTDSHLFNDMFNSVLGPIINYNDNESLDNIISYINDVIKYYSIFTNNINLPFRGNLEQIHLGGYYEKYLKYKQKYLELKNKF
ncbi:hypothetical protein Catovirus_2_34 [Catovirus CTV1]|uniref:Uncharacterized protein n=1 Tax=Catovirus CTV1 TaxID=1977631 RepID=A0A1V0SBJ1_9VIRU|nr:hypothetical protein Catovirus_2_34 [Catovirus CTV1]